jgi:hypothetical protein
MIQNQFKTQIELYGILITSPSLFVPIKGILQDMIKMEN